MLSKKEKARRGISKARLSCFCFFSGGNFPTPTDTSYARRTRSSFRRCKLYGCENGNHRMEDHPNSPPGKIPAPLSE